MLDSLQRYNPNVQSSLRVGLLNLRRTSCVARFHGASRASSELGNLAGFETADHQPHEQPIASGQSLERIAQHDVQM